MDEDFGFSLSSSILAVFCLLVPFAILMNVNCNLILLWICTSTSLMPLNLPFMWLFAIGVSCLEKCLLNPIFWIRFFSPPLSPSLPLFFIFVSSPFCFCCSVSSIVLCWWVIKLLYVSRYQSLGRCPILAFCPSLFSLLESLWSWKEIALKKKKKSASVHWPFTRDRNIAVFDAGAEMNGMSESPPGFRLPVSVRLFLLVSWWGKAMGAMGQSFEMWSFLHSWLPSLSDMGCVVLSLAFQNFHDFLVADFSLLTFLMTYSSPTVPGHPAPALMSVCPASSSTVPWTHAGKRKAVHQRRGQPALVRFLESGLRVTVPIFPAGFSQKLLFRTVISRFPEMMPCWLESLIIT